MEAKNDLKIIHAVSTRNKKYQSIKTNLKEKKLLYASEPPYLVEESNLVDDDLTLIFRCDIQLLIDIYSSLDNRVNVSNHLQSVSCDKTIFYDRQIRTVCSADDIYALRNNVRHLILNCFGILLNLIIVRSRKDIRHGNGEEDNHGGKYKA